MASGLTNKGLFRVLSIVLRGATPPTNFFIALLTDANVPGKDTNTLGELTQIATGNGYLDGGEQINRNSTDFDSLIEDDVLDQARIQVKDVNFTASGGPIPASGSGARYAVLTDDNGTIANREVWIFWDLQTNRVVSDTQSLTAQDFQVTGKHAA